MKRTHLFAKAGIAFLLLTWLLAACTTSQPTSLFAAPTVSSVTVDGDTITITGDNFFQVHPGSSLPSNLTVSVCGEVVGNLQLNGDTKTVVFAPGNVATITTATKIVGTLAGAATGPHDGIRITNPDGQLVNIDFNCDATPAPSPDPDPEDPEHPEEPEEPGEPTPDPAVFQLTIDFDVINENSEEEFTMRGASVTDPEDDYTTFAVPLSGIGEITINWGDDSAETEVENPRFAYGDTSPGLIHTYAESGTYTITVTGNLVDATIGLVLPLPFSARSFATQMDDVETIDVDRAVSALVSLDSWGTFGYDNLFRAFAELPNLERVPNYLPEGVTNLGGMFLYAPKFNSDISGWETAEVTNMEWMFEEAHAFNQDISEWNVTSVINMDGMFYHASSFNQNLYTWCATSLEGEPNVFAQGSKIEDDYSKHPRWGSECQDMGGPYEL